MTAGSRVTSRYLREEHEGERRARTRTRAGARYWRAALALRRELTHPDDIKEVRKAPSKAIDTVDKQ